jgi:uncharacterized protein
MKNKISELHLRVLALFTNGFDREYFIREMQRSLKVSSKTASVLLSDLESKGILEGKTKGKIKTYGLKNHARVNDYILMAETYKKIVFLENNNVIDEVITKVYPEIEGIGIIFGSYAKGTQKKDSDLDVFVVGEYNSKEIDRISRLYGIQISVKNYPSNVFKNNLRKDVLIREVLSNHIIFKGFEHFIEIVRGHGD